MGRASVIAPAMRPSSPLFIFVIFIILFQSGDSVSFLNNFAENTRNVVVDLLCGCTCRNISVKKCRDDTEKVCEEGFKKECVTKDILECDETYKKKCKTIQEKLCKKQKKNICKTTYKKVCTPTASKPTYGTPTEECRKVPEENCEVSYEKQCKTVPKEVCETVKVPDCKPAKQEKCRRVPTKTCTNVAVVVPYRKTVSQCQSCERYDLNQTRTEYEKQCRQVPQVICQTEYKEVELLVLCTCLMMILLGIPRPATMSRRGDARQSTRRSVRSPTAMARLARRFPRRSANMKRLKSVNLSLSRNVKLFTTINVKKYQKTLWRRLWITNVFGRGRG